MTKIQKSKVFFLFSILFFIFFSFPVSAARIYFESSGNKIGIGNNFEISVFVDTENENINAIEGEIIFPTSILELQQINDGGSFVSFWIKKPELIQNSIIFSGILPGGYEGKDGHLFSLIFKANKFGEAIFDAQNMQILKNEPAGEEVPIRIYSLKLNVVEQSSVPEFVAPKDTVPPEVFTPQIIKDPNLFEEKWFLVFLTQDKDSGIDSYQVQENRKDKIENEKWMSAVSPYLLTDQELKSYIYVKAIDKTGNERIATLLPQNQLVWYERYPLQIIFGAVIILLGTLIFILRKTIWLKLSSIRRKKQ